MLPKSWLYLNFDLILDQRERGDQKTLNREC